MSMDLGFGSSRDVMKAQIKRDLARALDGHTKFSRDCSISGDYLLWVARLLLGVNF